MKEETMTVYSVNLGIGWASSGVEYAQKYRANAFRKVGINAKFIFSDLILADNIEDLTKNMGFDDQQIIWLYNFFTDLHIAPTTYTIKQLEEELNLKDRTVSSKKEINNQIIYLLDDENLSIVARYSNKDKKYIDQVTYLRDNKLLKRDFYSYTKYAREYYLGTDNNYVTAREFYNEDGSIAYVEHLDNNKETFEFPGKAIVYTKNDLYRLMIRNLGLTQNDVIIIDREDEDKNLINSQIIFEEHQPAKLLVAIHADHFSKEFTNDDHILWNNFYEYQLTHSEEVDGYLVATEVQQKVLKEQMKKYFDVEPKIFCIPVGNLSQIKRVSSTNKPYSMITASRLAKEKHVDWLIKATVQAKKEIPNLSLDIYGRGGEAGKLSELINNNHAQDYIRLMGQHDLTNVYRNYGAYVAASTSEGFGLSLMEAVGSGLPMIGFNVPYGNPTFIHNDKNGFLLPYDAEWSDSKKCDELAQAMVQLFAKSNLTKFRNHSRQIAKNYLVGNVAQEWKHVLEELKNA